MRVGGGTASAKVQTRAADDPRDRVNIQKQIGNSSCAQDSRSIIFFSEPYISFLEERTASIVVVLTLTHRHNTMQSVVAGKAPITLEWEKYLGKNKTNK